MIRETLYVLAVPHLARSAEFYRTVLGFEILSMGDDGWRLFQRDCCKIMAGECPDAIPVSETGDHSYFAYLVVDDVEADFARARDCQVEIVKPLRTEPWAMREFGLRTIDGHRIMIGQRLAL